ncbi:hypothetical protein E4T56_gene1468 [Termitomyces sp. T112]|nr:hypothetical protein E4T56_gene1468 [Termitomyces sp. T112]
MSSSAYSSMPSALSLASPDPSSSEESESPYGCGQIAAMYHSSMAGPSGVPSSGRAPVESVSVLAEQSSQPNFGPGEVQVVPEALWVPQGEVTLEKFVEALGQVQGPPTLQWCQVEAPMSIPSHCDKVELS